MSITIEEYGDANRAQVMDIWNQVVEDGMAFPQNELLTEETAAGFFAAQDFVGVARLDGEVAGLYILHPNNVGRCGHQANASYAVARNMWGKKVGEALVTHCLDKAAQLGYRLMIFNAVVKGNDRALNLYSSLGFTRVGEIPGGFYTIEGIYRDIILFYKELQGTERTARQGQAVVSG